jgi:hypothetical protein
MGVSNMPPGSGSSGSGSNVSLTMCWRTTRRISAKGLILFAYDGLEEVVNLYVHRYFGGNASRMLCAVALWC